MFTGCLYDPAVIHKCVQVDTARSRDEAYGWELPLHDLRVLASRLTGIDVCVEHERDTSVGVVQTGFVDQRGRLMCRFQLFDQIGTSTTTSRSKTQQKHRSTPSPAIAATVKRWIKAGKLRELSLQHVRNTLEPLEVSIVVAGARPNSLIQRQMAASTVQSTQTQTRLGNCKRTPTRPDQDRQIVTVTASQRTDIQRMNTRSTMPTDTTSPMEQTDEPGPEPQPEPEPNESRAREDKEEEEEEEGEEVEEQDDQLRLEDGHDVSQGFNRLFLEQQQQQQQPTPESASILATAMKDLLRAYSHNRDHHNNNNNNQISATLTSPDTEEHRLSAATAFVTGTVYPEGEQDFISPRICVAVRAAIDAMQCSGQSTTTSATDTMPRHTSTLAAARWIEKLCEVDQQSSNQSHVHELDLVAASKTDLRTRIQNMFVPKNNNNNNNNFDVPMARALTGTLRRGIHALRPQVTTAKNTRTPRPPGTTNTVRASHNTRKPTKKRTTKATHPNKQIARDFKPRKPTRRVDPFQEPTQSQHSRINKRKKTTTRQQQQQQQNNHQHIEDTDRPTRSKRTRRPHNNNNNDKTIQASGNRRRDGPFAHLRGDDAAWMKQFIDGNSNGTFAEPGILALRPVSLS
jgi:hypothetical protein